MVLTLDLKTTNNVVTDLIWGWRCILSVGHLSVWRAGNTPSQKASDADFLARKWWNHSWSLIRRHKQEILEENSSRKKEGKSVKSFMYLLGWSMEEQNWWGAGWCGMAQVTPVTLTAALLSQWACWCQHGPAWVTFNIWGGLRWCFREYSLTTNSVLQFRF